MTAKASSKTADKVQKKVPGIPFVKGDPRINRKGRPPNNSPELNALLDEIFAEVIERKNPLTGKTTRMEKLRAALNGLLLNKNPAGAIHILDRRFGKVTERVDLTSGDKPLQPETMSPSEIAERVAALLKSKHAKPD